MPLSALAAITKYDGLGDPATDLFLVVLEAGSLRSRCGAGGAVSSEASLPALQTAIILPSVHVHFLISSSQKDPPSDWIKAHTNA